MLKVSDKTTLYSKSLNVCLVFIFVNFWINWTTISNVKEYNFHVSSFSSIHMYLFLKSITYSAPFKNVCYMKNTKCCTHQNMWFNGIECQTAFFLWNAIFLEHAHSVFMHRKCLYKIVMHNGKPRFITKSSYKVF